MATDLDRVRCARLPVAALASLAELRCRPDVLVTTAGDRAWVRWSSGGGPLLDRLMAVPGVELFARRDDGWFRLGDRLPAFDVPPEDGTVPLHRAIVPARFVPEPAPGEVGGPVALGLARDERPRAATALRCRLADLAGWAERATSAQVEALRAARSGDLVLLLGRRLPPIGGAERFWGDRLLVPLGFRPDPELAEPILLDALGAVDGERVLLDAAGAEVVPSAAFRPLGRAAVRLATGPPPGRGGARP